jgi:hypothetical protein
MLMPTYIFSHAFTGWYHSLNVGSTVFGTTGLGSTIGTTASGFSIDGSYATLASAASSGYGIIV